MPSLPCFQFTSKKVVKEEEAKKTKKTNLLSLQLSAKGFGTDTTHVEIRAPKIRRTALRCTVFKRTNEHMRFVTYLNVVTF